jgi:nucleotide-binding universal stress UspA family protein
LAAQALPHAAAQAACFGAEIILLKVLGPLPEPVTASRAALRVAAEKSAGLALDYLERVAADIRERDIPVQTLTIEGKPYLEIINYAEKNDIDLIVISTRGHSGWSRWLLGSVADRVVRGANVPVLLVQCTDPCAA